MSPTLSVDTDILFGIVSGKPPKKSSRKQNFDIPRAEFSRALLTRADSPIQPGII